MAGIVVDLGTREEAEKSDFPPPAVSGIYKVRILSPNTSANKKFPDDVTNVRFQVVTLTDTDGNAVEPGYASWIAFVVNPKKKDLPEYDSYVRGGVKKWRNLAEHVMKVPPEKLAAREADNVAKGKPPGVRAPITPEAWKGIETWARIQVRPGKDLRTGADVMEGTVQSFLSDEEAAGTAPAESIDDEAQAQATAEAASEAAQASAVKAAAAKTAQAQKATAAAAGGAATSKAAPATRRAPVEVIDEDEVAAQAEAAALEGDDEPETEEDELIPTNQPAPGPGGRRRTTA